MGTHEIDVGFAFCVFSDLDLESTKTKLAGANFDQRSGQDRLLGARSDLKRNKM